MFAQNRYKGPQGSFKESQDMVAALLSTERTLAEAIPVLSFLRSSSQIVLSSLVCCALAAWICGWIFVSPPIIGSLIGRQNF